MAQHPHPDYWERVATEVAGLIYEELVAGGHPPAQATTVANYYLNGAKRRVEAAIVREAVISDACIEAHGAVRH